ncbi:MAG TPA: DUF559 domain-containing protein [Acidimicrobiales bacterium]|nr:DUF559 domain-containing protein [Acidimicrobiales bacterium]
MRRFFTTREALAWGVSEDVLAAGDRHGHWRRVIRGAYGEGPEEPSALDRAVAKVLVTGGVASGDLAGVLLGLDGVALTRGEVTVPASSSGRRAGVRRYDLDPARIIAVEGIRCTDAIQTLVDLAATLDDDTWEQALESALRRRMTTVDDVERAGGVRRARLRIDRVLARRGRDAAATESLLETRAVQLARTVDGLGPPVRQYVVRDEDGRFVARVDLAWPELGLFLELDGQQHKGQPLYDARRETAIVAATGWLCGRFTWDEIVRHPTATARRLAALVERARRRPLAA